MTTTAEILQKARDLISDEKNWTQGEYASGQNGLYEDPRSNDACRFCAVGAVARVIGISGYQAEDHEAVKLLDAETGGIASFNDDHSHDETLAVFDRAIKRAISAEEAA